MDPRELPVIVLEDEDLQDKVQNVLKTLILSEQIQEQIRRTFLSEMQLGMSICPAKASSLQMENTFISELLKGSETGEYLSLDLGGTNFRVIFVKLIEGKCVEETLDYYEVPESLRLGEGKLLFDFLASCIADFIRKKNLPSKNYKLGFTFSFPMVQKAVDVGILVSWTKSFNCPGVVGEDAVKMLNDAIHRRKDLDITVTAVLNDTTGTLVMGSYLDKRCAVGMILGTGCNACYLENVKNIEKWEGDHSEKEVIIDTEWGAFGDNGVLAFIKTEWDQTVDEKSLLVNSFTFEKYFSGKYLGDLVREILFSLSSRNLFCRGETASLGSHGAIKTSDVAQIERESFEGKSDTAMEVLKRLNLEYSQDDISIFQYVCGITSYRGIVLVSLLTALLLERMQRPHCTVAIDGSLFKHHPRFQPLMEHLISAYAPNNSFSLLLAQDGSGKGAALVAAIVDRLKKSGHKL